MTISPVGAGHAGAARSQATPAPAAKRSQDFADLLKRLLDGQAASALGPSHKTAPAAQAPAAPAPSAGISIRA